jgi:hypothetical protein
LVLPFLPIGRSFVKQIKDNPHSASLAMDRSYLGEFETLVLLTVASLEGEVYRAAITRGIQQKTGRMVVLRAVNAALYRLQENIPAMD